MPDMKELCNTRHCERIIMITALLLRLIALLVVYGTADGMAAGFVDSTTYYDDVRYEAGAEYYSEHAADVIDVDTFTQAYDQYEDWVGHKLATPFDSTPLWYWVCCITTYIFRTKWAIRLLNVLLASLGVLYVFRFAECIYGHKAAVRSAWLLALLPYPVFFSCFAYKDHLVLVITFYLLYKAVFYRMGGQLGPFDIIKIILLGLTLMLVRSGLSVVLFAVCLIIAFVKDFKLDGTVRKKIILLLPAMVICMAVLLAKYSGTILYKLEFYLTRHEETLSGTTISYMTINGLSDLYKLPFAYMLAVIMPIGLFEPIHSWYSVIATANIVMCPISVGAALYLFEKKPEKIVFWSCFALYAVSIVTSLNIFRHYYSLLPFMLISFSAFTLQADRSRKLLFSWGTMTFSLVLILYYGLR